jgi:hypothetical protein
MAACGAGKEQGELRSACMRQSRKLPACHFTAAQCTSEPAKGLEQPDCLPADPCWQQGMVLVQHWGQRYTLQGAHHSSLHIVHEVALELARSLGVAARLLSVQRQTQLVPPTPAGMVSKEEGITHSQLFNATVLNLPAMSGHSMHGLVICQCITSACSQMVCLLPKWTPNPVAYAS